MAGGDFFDRRQEKLSLFVKSRALGVKWEAHGVS